MLYDPGVWCICCGGPLISGLCPSRYLSPHSQEMRNAVMEELLAKDLMNEKPVPKSEYAKARERALAKLLSLGLS